MSGGLLLGYEGLNGAIRAGTCCLHFTGAYICLLAIIFIKSLPYICQFLPFTNILFYFLPIYQYYIR